MFIIYFLFTVITWFISILPFRVLYIVSDLLYFNLYYIFKYRRAVVYKNLRNSFTEKSKIEIKKIEKQFYKNLSDVIVEVIKTQNMTEEQMKKRFTFTNLNILEDLYKNNKSIIACMGHCGNWEWLGPALHLRIKHEGKAVIKPLSDKFFDKYMFKLRTKFTKNPDCLISHKHAFKIILKNRNKLTLNIFVADQTPLKKNSKYWTKFLNQDTSFFLGPEKIAKTLDFAVVFLDIQRVNRGYYNIEIIKITDEPKKTDEYEITQKFHNLLEKSIIKHPDNWLWSHRRWKHKKD